MSNLVKVEVTFESISTMACTTNINLLFRFVDDWS